jgi:hypothetical protein
MKKLLITMTATLVCVGAFGQGKLAFVNGPDQLIYMIPDASWMNPADVGKTVNGFPLAGSSLYTGTGGTIASLAGAPSFSVALFAGATANSLSQVTVGTLGNADFGGFINPQVNVTLASLPAGTPAFFQIQVFDSRYTDSAAAWANATYAGESTVFQATPQLSVYSPIYQASAPVNSTLPIGTFVPVDYAAFPGYHGLIMVTGSPEPGTLALAVLGAAMLMITRRRR